MVFIVVQHEGCYSDQEWRIVAVNDTLRDAEIYGWTVLVNEALQPWKIKFYRRRTGEFADAIGISDYHIEEWVGCARINEYFLGRDDKNHAVDKYLKDHAKTVEETLLDWKRQLESGVIPSELHLTLAT